MSFFEALWDSVFQPGVPPVLVGATHVSFTLLLALLLALLWTTRNLHFMALSVIAAFLWATVSWFVRELARAEAKAAPTAAADEAVATGSWAAPRTAARLR
ncbi:AFR216Wp [Eremothecium gossypii ATCC 10895]|uniref:AFR216Wp n=1 Tax=Eremothecium gossypii (strain ATCC 10895 / CBS 109.51 / FGSC 9923 / NRRL Y-1056) TaxID=284811 RepID=Q754H8_EREGS|nr:AFR216Wp [Eremothecium gossypii ATCC 10895]AAS53587.1 AFR216Wp [Eremothecium gossypii ATCC 10895]AEY97900.1 FAFR216Wp [Eremothecium gossypii FDAG1]